MYYQNQGRTYMYYQNQGSAYGAGGYPGGGSSGGSMPSLEDLLNYQAPSYEYNPATPDINIGDLNYDPNASYGLLGGKG